MNRRCRSTSRNRPVRRCRTPARSIRSRSATPTLSGAPAVRPPTGVRRRVAAGFDPTSAGDRFARALEPDRDHPACDPDSRGGNATATVSAVTGTPADWARRAAPRARGAHVAADVEDARRHAEPLQRDVADRSMARIASRSGAWVTGGLRRRAIATIAPRSPGRRPRRAATASGRAPKRFELVRVERRCRGRRRDGRRAPEAGPTEQAATSTARTTSRRGRATIVTAAPRSGGRRHRTSPPRSVALPGRRQDIIVPTRYPLAILETAAPRPRPVDRRGPAPPWPGGRMVEVE